MTKLAPRRLAPVLVAGLACSAAACEDESVPPQTPAAVRADTDPGMTVRLEPIQEGEPSPSAVRVDLEIAKLCKLPDAFFPFDSSKITGPAADTLQALADCVTDGALQGRSLNVVGHADPRGTDTYNLSLGHRRAGSVADFLVDAGMARANLETTSMGELKADGEGPLGWAMDRRVDIHLMPADDTRREDPVSSN